MLAFFLLQRHIETMENLANALFGNINYVVSQVFFFNILFFVEGANVPLAVAWAIFAAVFLTIKMRFINFRYFKHAILLTRGCYDKAHLKGDVSHFKALTTALSATVGLGNVAGVAIAISTGGPGATFWLMMAGLFGMTSKFAECTLAQMYRSYQTDGQVLGGPMLYLKDGFAKRNHEKIGKILSIVFALLCICGSYGGGGAFQVNQSMYAVAEVIPQLNDFKWAYGLLMAVMVAVVIIGGIQRIANVAEKIVPLMCLTYIVMAIYILGYYVAEIPTAFVKIFSEAFSPDAMYGGVLGVMVTGMRRAAFSNEAGMGSAAIAHSAAKTEHPVQEGIVALLEPFIDTVVICTMTALILVITGAYNNPDYIDLIHAKNGAGLTSRALGQVNPFFPYALCFVVFLFAYSTIISWSYYGERSFTYLFGAKYSLIYKISLVIVIFLGAIATAVNIMEFGDLMILGMAFPNLIGVFYLSGEVKEKLNEYVGLLKSGKISRTK